jgi:hypothetical protein
VSSWPCGDLGEEPFGQREQPVQRSWGRNAVASMGSREGQCGWSGVRRGERRQMAALEEVGAGGTQGSH